jgi:hypothetical protein
MRCGTGTGGGTRGRRTVRVGVDDGATSPGTGDAETGNAQSSSSSSDVVSLLTVTSSFAASSGSSRRRWYLACSYKGHLRRSRAGMRVRLHGGTKARAEVIEEEEDGSDDEGGGDDDDDVYKVVVSVASAEEVREDAMRATEGEAVRPSSLGFEVLRRCESGKSVSATSGRVMVAPKGKSTVRSSDIGATKLKNIKDKRTKLARMGRVPRFGWLEHNSLGKCGVGGGLAL